MMNLIDGRETAHILGDQGVQPEKVKKNENIVF